MRVDNTFDEVLFAAVHASVLPDAGDLAQVRVPAGEDAEKFRASLVSAAKQIVSLRKQGRFGDAREVASKAQGDYLAKFEALMPIPAGQQESQPTTAAADDLSAVGARIFGR